MSAPWTPEESRWARECFEAGDSLGEIAETADRGFVDVEMHLGVYGFVPLERRWRQRGEDPRPFVGGMLREVARARCGAGEEPIALAIEARCGRSAMFRAVKGIVPRRWRLPDHVRALEAAA